MPSRPWLNIQANESAIVEIQDRAREKEFNGPSGSYTKWIYDVLHNGQEKSIGATKGLHSMMEANSFRVGDVVKISRTGEGLSTRWLVGLERGDTNAPVRAPSKQARAGVSVDDLWSNFDNFYEALRLRRPELSEDSVAVAASVMAAGAVSVGIMFPGYGSSQATPAVEGKVSPEAYVRQMMIKAKIPNSVQNALGRFLFGEAVATLSDVTREHAEFVYSLTENGTVPAHLADQYDRMVGDDAEEELPF